MGTERNNRPKGKGLRAHLPTNSELEILAALSALQVATVRQIHDRLDKDCTYTTTLKQIQGMLTKGFIQREERFGVHVYRAHTPRKDVQKQVIRDVLRHIFGGSRESLILGALQAEPTSASDLAQLRALIEGLIEQRDGKE